jgi:hypothetical protein
MINKKMVAAAMKLGTAKATEIVAGRVAARQKRTVALQALHNPVELQPRVLGVLSASAVHMSRTAGFLVAAGDSWFDYPFHDVLKILHDDYGYNVESTSHRGDPIEVMAYLGGQIDGLARAFEKVVAQGAVPKAVLLSGGGDDIAGNEFGMLLNNKESPIGGWNTDILRGVISERIGAAYVVMLKAIDQLSMNYVSRTLPIVVHGYDYPVPDGRGFLGGWGPLPGPWLQPGFREKNFDDVRETITLMHEAIDQFNQMLVDVAALPQFAHVHYVDLRGTLANDNTYQTWWANELHPTKQGFEAVTARFADTLRGLP